MLQCLIQNPQQGRVVCSVHVRSTSAAVATAFREGAAAWLADISGGLLRPAGEITVRSGATATTRREVKPRACIVYRVAMWCPTQSLCPCSTRVQQPTLCLPRCRRMVGLQGRCSR